MKLNEEQLEFARKLRELSGYGMMECKKALISSNFDINKALIYLKKCNDFGKLNDYWINGSHVSKQEYDTINLELELLKKYVAISSEE